MSKILKIRISMLHIRPKIWRELLVANSITFEDLHKIIQLAFDWTNSHLYNFDVNGTLFSLPDEEYENDDLDVKTRISKYLFSKGQKCIYTYDFGDNWEHEIEIIDILEREKIQYPKCIGGKRNSPPEDCGSIPGYENVVQALKSKNKRKYRDILGWLGDYDLEKFDIDEVNEAIRNPDEYLLDFSDFY